MASHDGGERRRRRVELGGGCARSGCKSVQVVTQHTEHKALSVPNRYHRARKKRAATGKECRWHHVQIETTRYISEIRVRSTPQIDGSAPPLSGSVSLFVAWELRFQLADALAHGGRWARQIIMTLDRDLFEFLERTADAAFTVSDSGEICSWNASAERLFGFARWRLQRPASSCFRAATHLGRWCTEHCHLRDCAASARWMLTSISRSPCARRSMRTSPRSVRRFEDRGAAGPCIWRGGTVESGRRPSSAECSRCPGNWSRSSTVKASAGTRGSRFKSYNRKSFAFLSRPATWRDWCELKISSQTLRNHLHRINQKLGTHTRMEAVLHAIRRNLISPVRDCQTSDCGRARWRQVGRFAR